MRNIAIRDTPERRHELAEGLGYWASRYLSLNASEPAPNPGERPSAAIAKVPRLPKERRTGDGLIYERVALLNDFPPFADVLDLTDVLGDQADFLSDLTETFARLYLTNREGGDFFTLLHALTGTSAARLILPNLPPKAAQNLLRCAWQAGAGLYAAYASTADLGAPGETSLAPEDLVDRAVRNGDVHAIKMTEVCLREYALNPKPVFILAADDALRRFGG